MFSSWPCSRSHEAKMNTALRLQEFVESHSEAPPAASRIIRILQYPVIRSIWSLAILIVSLVLRVTNLPVLILPGTAIKDVSATGKPHRCRSEA
jgi:hypothetical protein